MKSDIEEFCKLQFDKFVRARLKFKSILWENIAQIDEPPDYFLYLDDIKFAVEVTTLMEKIQVGNLYLSEINVIASLWNLVNKVEARAKENHCLNGAYLVSFSRPLTNFDKIRKQLFNDLLTYVEVTQIRSSAPEQIVFEEDDQKCAIKKMHDQKNYIGKAGPNRGKWDSQAPEEIYALIEERINSKYHKLRKISESKILLLFNTYHSIGQEIYRVCLDRLINLDFFHTVIVIEGDGTQYCIHSENSSWLSVS